MIKVDIAVPFLLPVTTVAGAFEFGPVRAGGTMAGHAIGTQFLSGDVGRMTNMAVELGVNADQGKFGLGQMIVFDWVPHIVVVAVVALGSKASGV